MFNYIIRTRVDSLSLFLYFYSHNEIFLKDVQYQISVYLKSAYDSNSQIKFPMTYNLNINGCLHNYVITASN